MLMEQVFPINKADLDEQKSGNLVPSCQACNDSKHYKKYRDFLADRPETIDRIEKYRREMGYEPLSGDFSQIQEIIELAKRYLAI